MEKISIIIPVYNEYMKVHPTNYHVNMWCLKHNLDAEIVFVNDGSTDITQVYLDAISKNYPNITTIKIDENHGKGFAVRKGLLYSKHPIKVVLDCDLSISIEELANISLSSMKKKHIIKGIRKQVIKQPLHRIIVGKIWKSLVFIKTGMYIDTQAPFWVMNCPKEFYESLTTDGFAFDVEILAKARRQGYRIDFVSVKYYNDPDSRVTIRKTLRMLKELAKIKR